jgi:hypothetical protein
MKLTFLVLLLTACNEPINSPAIDMAGPAALARPIVATSAGSVIVLDDRSHAHVKPVDGVWLDAGPPGVRIVAGLTPAATRDFEGAFGFGDDGHVYQLARASGYWSWTDDGPPPAPCDAPSGEPLAESYNAIRAVSVVVACANGNLMELHNESGDWSWDLRWMPSPAVGALKGYELYDWSTVWFTTPDNHLFMIKSANGRRGLWTDNAIDLAAPPGTLTGEVTAGSYGGLAITDDRLAWQWVRDGWGTHPWGLWVAQPGPTGACAQLYNDPGEPLSFAIDGTTATRFAVLRCSSDVHTIVQASWLSFNGVFVWSEHRDASGGAFVSAPFPVRLADEFAILVIRDDEHVIRFHAPSLIGDWQETDEGAAF